MNYIHDIDYKVFKSVIDGVEAEGLYNAVIEISNGDNVKYEVHPNGKYLTAVRALNSIFRYPFSYGYIPQTLAPDKDGLDVIVITPEPLAHLSVIEVRLLGYVPTIDKGFDDSKIIAVPAYSRLKKVALDKVMAFLNNYKYPDNESSSVGNFIADIEKTTALVEQAHKAYLNSIVRQNQIKEPINLKTEQTPIIDKINHLKIGLGAPDSHVYKAQKSQIVSTVLGNISETTSCTQGIEKPVVDANSSTGDSNKEPIETEVPISQTLSEDDSEEQDKENLGWLT